MSKVSNRHGGGAKQTVYQDNLHYYKINFFFSLLDLLTNDISNCFFENDLDILQALYDVLCEENPPNDVIKKSMYNIQSNRSRIKRRAVYFK